MKTISNNIKKISFDINNPLVGYVLYERDLDEEYFLECINEIFSLHDVFRIDYKNQKELKASGPKVGEIHLLDEIVLNGKIDFYISSDSNLNNNIIDLRLIYFNNCLRGYFFKCNSNLFDDSSLNNMIKAIEKQYFSGKYKQTSSSYLSWLEENNCTLDTGSKPFDCSVGVKTISFDESDTKLIKKYLKRLNIDLEQFIISALGIYFTKINNNEQFTFKSNCFDPSVSGIIGNTGINDKYSLSLSSGSALLDIMKKEILESNGDADVYVSGLMNNSNIKGKVKRFISKESVYPLEFKIADNEWDIDIDIIYQKNKYDVEEVNLMISRLDRIMDSLLNHNSMKYNKLSLLSKQEEAISFKYSEIEYMAHSKKIYDLFAAQRIKNSSGIAVVEDNKSYTYLELSTSVLKLIKTLKKAGVKEGTKVGFEFTRNYDAIIAILAIDSLSGVYSLDFDESEYIIKHGMFGHKVSKHKDVKLLKGVQYVSSNKKVARSNFQGYCHWYSEYFEITEKDSILISSENNSVDFMINVIPALVAGVKLVSRDKNSSLVDQVTNDKITVLNAKPKDIQEFINRYKGETLKHVILKNTTFPYKKTHFKIHIGTTADDFSPFVFMNTISEGDLSLGKPLPGVGVLVLDEEKSLSLVYEIGDLHIFGPFVTSSNEEMEKLTVSGRTFDHVSKTDLRAKWTLNGNLIKA